MISIQSQWMGEAITSEERGQIPILVSWSSDDPLVLSCSFEGTLWDIGRDLIWQAYKDSPQPTGQGDVTATFKNSSLYLKLSTLEGSAEIWMPEWRMYDFLRKSYALVAKGSEAVDVDNAIEKLLKGA